LDSVNFCISLVLQFPCAKLPWIRGISGNNNNDKKKSEVWYLTNFLPIDGS